MFCVLCKVRHLLCSTFLRFSISIFIKLKSGVPADSTKNTFNDFRYSYDPFTQSLNEFPEAEVQVTAGDYVLVWGEADEDGYYEGKQFTILFKIKVFINIMKHVR